ncbi:DUF4214 domain-containing protein [Nitrincola alkalilacustris]|uniref:DUF4214 domain-containing protein n=1 Tax=Nitrincola alkalilacustris TaxID=1571224 RepID=UPI00124DAE5C|nr:DUF4214 domain-containing protein [Nitrincola alkalilacustris]
MAFSDDVQKAYIAYYGRPADPAGLAFWVDQLEGVEGNLDEIIQAFANSAESQALFGTMDPEDQIDSLYQQLFNRAPDAAGKQFYVDLLAENAGEPGFLGKIALMILDGAQNEDLTTINNKLAVAVRFTAALEADVDANAAYDGDAAAATARAMLANVDDATDTDAFDIATTIQQLKDDVPGVPGQTFVLTTGQDNIQGTADDDTILGIVDGANNTFTLGDVINGGAGTDTLKITTDQGALNLGIATISNVEKFIADIRDDGFDTLNLANNAFTKATLDFNGMEHNDSVDVLSVNRSTALEVKNVDLDGNTLTISYAGSAAINNSLSLTNVENGDVNVEFNHTDDKAAGSYTVNLDNVKDVELDLDDEGAALELNVVVNGDSSGLDIRNYSSSAFAGAAAVVNVTLNADLQVDWWDLSDANDSTTSFNIMGSGNLTIDSLDDGSSELTVNAGTATGNIDITFGTSDLVSVTTGSGDDRIVLDNDYFVADSELVVALGTGFNTLGISDVSNQTDLADLDFSDVTLSGVGALEFADSITLTGDATLDLEGVGNISKLVVADLIGAGWEFQIDNAQATLNIESKDTFDDVYLYLDAVSTLNLSAEDYIDVQLDDANNGYNDVLENVTITSAEGSVDANIYDLAMLKNLTIVADADNENNGSVNLDLDGAPELLTVSLTAGDEVYAVIQDAAKLTTVTVVAGDDNGNNYLELNDTPKVTLIDLSGLTGNDDGGANENGYIEVYAEFAAFAQAVTIMISAADLDYIAEGDGTAREIIKFVGDDIGTVDISNFTVGVGSNGDRLDFSAFAGVNSLDDLVIVLAGADTVITSTAFEGEITVIGADVSSDAFNFIF